MTDAQRRLIARHIYAHTTSTNTIRYDQIADGRGQLSDGQQPRDGQQLYDIIWPF